MIWCGSCVIFYLSFWFEVWRKVLVLKLGFNIKAGTGLRLDMAWFETPLRSEDV